MVTSFDVMKTAEKEDSFAI